MFQAQQVNWPTINGQSLTFEVYPINSVISPNYEGNYIFAKFTGQLWEAIYIGEGILKDRIDCHRSEGKVLQKGATHIHIRVNTNMNQRCNDESLLLIGNPEAYSPKGCNVKKGG